MTREVAVFNPNSSEAVTAAIRDHLCRKLPEGGWYCVSNPGAPEILMSPADFVRAEGTMLAALAARPFAAVVIAAFGDPGREVLQTTGAPVVGMGSTGLFAASAYGRFGVVTARKQHEGLTLALVDRLGLRARCAGIEPLEIDPIEFVRTPAVVEPALRRCAERLAAAGARALCLGSSTLATLVDRLRAHSSLPLVDSLLLSTRVALELTAADG